MQEKLIDYEVVKSSYKSLQQKYNDLVAKEVKIIQAKPDRKIEKFNRVNFEKYIPNSQDFVAMAKYKEVADKLVKEKLRNEKNREEIKTLKRKNQYLSDNTTELVSIFDSFLRSTDLQFSQGEDNTDNLGKIGKIPKITPTTELLINSQFKNLENYLEEYNTLKSSVVTNKLFKEKLAKFKIKNETNFEIFG